MNLWVDAATGNTKAQRHVALLVHRDTSHPAEVRVRRVSALLEDSRRCAGRANLVPTHTDARSRRYTMVEDQRFMVTKVSIS